MFALEVVVKLLGLGFSFYFSQGSNIFDFVVTAASIVALIPSLS